MQTVFERKCSADSTTDDDDAVSDGDVKKWLFSKVIFSFFVFFNYFNVESSCLCVSAAHPGVRGN